MASLFDMAGGGPTPYWQMGGTPYYRSSLDWLFFGNQDMPGAAPGGGMAPPPAPMANNPAAPPIPPMVMPPNPLPPMGGGGMPPPGMPPMGPPPMMPPMGGMQPGMPGGLPGLNRGGGVGPAPAARQIVGKAAQSRGF